MSILFYFFVRFPLLHDFSRVTFRSTRVLVPENQEIAIPSVKSGSAVSADFPQNSALSVKSFQRRMLVVTVLRPL